MEREEHLFFSMRPWQIQTVLIDGIEQPLRGSQPAFYVRCRFGRKFMPPQGCRRTWEDTEAPRLNINGSFTEYFFAATHCRPVTTFCSYSEVTRVFVAHALHDLARLTASAPQYFCVIISSSTPVHHCRKLRGLLPQLDAGSTWR